MVSDTPMFDEAARAIGNAMVERGRRYFGGLHRAEPPVARGMVIDPAEPSPVPVGQAPTEIPQPPTEPRLRAQVDKLLGRDSRPTPW